jgi:hypothetical protein
LREFEKFLIGQEEKIFYLNQYAVFDQCVFRKKFIEMIYLFAITAIDGEMAVRWVSSIGN